MTKDELREEIYNDLTTEFYCSDAQEAIDTLPGHIRAQFDQIIFDLLNNFADSCIETMERNDVIAYKDALQIQNEGGVENE